MGRSFDSFFMRSNATDYEVANRGIAPTTDALITAPAEIVSALSPNIPSNTPEKKEASYHSKETPSETIDQVDSNGVVRPTEEQRTTLRRVSGSIPWIAYSLCIVEFAERASYYGCSFVFSNFVQFPLP